MKRFVQATGLVLIALMVAIFSACSKSSSNDASPSATAPAGGSASVSQTPSDSSQQPVENATLDVFAMTSDRSGEQSGWWPDILKEKTGVTLNLIPAGDQANQKLQSMMAGGELADIVVFTTQKQVEDAVKADMLVNLDEHMDQLPNVAKFAAKALQYYRDTASNGTGKAYAIPSELGPVALGNDLNWGPYLRWDLYKKLGKPEINKAEDYLPLLKKMQELEPKNKDGQKVYGFSMWKDWDNTTMHQAMTFTNMFGVETGDQLSESLPFYQVDFTTGETKSILAPDSQYIRALKIYYQANQMGLVDPDSLTQRFENASEKVAQGRVLFAWWPWFGFNYNTTGSRMDADPPSGFRPALSKESKITMKAENKIGEVWAYAIGKSTKHLDASLRLIDFLYSVEGTDLRTNGPKGVIWDFNDKGDPFITDQGWDIINNSKEMPGGGKLADGPALLTANPLSGATINPATNLPVAHDFWPSTKEHQPTKLDKDWQDITGFKSATDMMKANNQYVEMPEAIKTIPTLPDDMNTLKQRIGEVVKNESWLAVFAKNDADFQKHIDTMVKKAEGYGIQQLIDWDNENWKKAQEIVKKYE